MSLANDKISNHTRLIAANALVANRVTRAGFTNVIMCDALAFASGNRAERCVFVGETVPGADYDSVVQIGDEYLQFTFSANVMTGFKRWVYDATGWYDCDEMALYTTLELTNAQILALNATPITAIAAPGAGKVIEIVKVVGVHDYATAAFGGIAEGEDLNLCYTNGSGAVLASLETTGWLDATADELAFGLMAKPATLINAAVVAHVNTGEIITGGGTIDLHIWYRVHTVANYVL